MAMDEEADSLVRDLLSSCWALERQRLTEDKQNLLRENVQLRAELLQLQRDHIALLQLVSVLRQQHQQSAETPAAPQSPGYSSHSGIPSPSQLPPRHMQQHQIARRSGTPRQPSGPDESPAVAAPLSRKSTPLNNTKKPKLHSSIQRSIRSLMSPRNSWSKGFNSSNAPEIYAAADGSYSSFPSSSNSKVIIDVAALTGLARSSVDFGILGLQQQQQQQYRLPRMHSSSSSSMSSSRKTPRPLSRSYDCISNSSSNQKPSVSRRTDAGANSSSSHHQSSSPGVNSSAADSSIVDYSNNQSSISSSKIPRGWRQNRPPPLTALHTAPDATHITAAAAVGASPVTAPKLLLSPSVSKASSNCSSGPSGRSTSSIKYNSQCQQQQQHRGCTVDQGNKDYDSSRITHDVDQDQQQFHHSDHSAVAEPTWSETPTHVHCISSSSTVEGTSTPSSSGEEGRREDTAAVEDNSSSSSSNGCCDVGDLHAVPKDIAAAAAGADNDALSVLIREDTASLLTKVSLDANASPDAAATAVSLKAYINSSSSNSSSAQRLRDGYVLYGRPASRTQAYKYPGSPDTAAAAAVPGKS